MANPWTISQFDRQKYEGQFLSLKPVNGFVTGPQAREFFLKSGLPAQVLAQIWDLSDLNKDGKMDKREFCIAVHLIQKKLQGSPLPSTLPDSMKIEPGLISNAAPLSANFQGRMPVGLTGLPPLAPPLLPPMNPVIFPSAPPAITSTANTVQSGSVSPMITRVDWTMPNSNRLKYSQQFNSIDKDKTGFLSGVQARGIFGRSDLPSATLARIWYLSDLDKDGRLTVDEFCIASHLIDLVKHGATVPSSLPSELAPENWQRSFRQRRTSSIGSGDLPPSPKQSASFSYDGELIKAPKMIVTFEDKRRQNLERGQAEIERRRLLLQEQEKREREERERKQREERERLEREREEKERRRQLEIQRQQAKLREEQDKRDQEFKQMLEQKEAARREAERQRKSELERQRLLELRNQHQREQEAVYHARRRQKDLSFQVQSLAEKARQLDDRVTEMRGNIVSTTDSLEVMKAVRDKALMDIENGKRQVQELRTRLMQYDNEKVGLLSKRRTRAAAVNSSLSDTYQQMLTACRKEEMNLDSLRRSLAEVDEQIRRKQSGIEDNEKPSRNFVEQARREISEYREVVQSVNRALARVREMKNTRTVSNGNGPATTASSGANTVPYRVIYDFDAASEGELTLRVGDTVLVFVDHPVEDGWLTGQIGEKVGWFPCDFAVPSNDQSATIQASTAMENVNAVNLQQEAVSVPEMKRDIEGEWYEAVYPFPASEPGDLGFESGDKILVVQKSGDWWTGRIDDREGIFPSNYVQSLAEQETADEAKLDHAVSEPAEQRPKMPNVVVAESSPRVEPMKRDSGSSEVARAIATYQAADENQLSLEVGDLVRVRSKSPAGWWEGELQRKGEPSRVGWFPGNYVELLTAAAAAADSDNSRPAGSTSDANSPTHESVEALFDYTKQQEDELSFTKGSVITILDKLDDSWWKGRLADGQVGLLPSNYVTSRSSSSVRNGDNVVDDSRCSSASSTPTSELRKRSMYCQELEQTEQNYVDDLQMVVDVFYKQLEVSGFLTPKEVSILFVNWKELISTACSFVNDLRSSSEDRLGATILKNVDNLRRVFITFCRHQQSALDFLESKEKASARFRALHAQCSQHPAARGLQLSYFLLIPLARVTKYHLVVKEILKYTPKDHPDQENLRNAHAALRRLCDDVNEVATETENLQTLYWCQHHIKCDSIQPRLVFHSPTNNLGPRRFVHAGILYKVPSNRLLVGLLFNDFLMLTTPDEKISQPETFKLNRGLEIALSLYKTPVLLPKANLQSGSSSNSADGNSSGDENTFVLQYGDDAINLRAVSSNAKILWMKQLEKAIKLARESASPRSKSVTISSSGVGRLLFEVVFVRNLVIPQDCKGASFYIEFAFGGQKHTKSIDLTRTDTLCTTQMVLESKTESMKLAIFAERIYSPDICVGRAEMEMEAMLKMSASQRNPAVMQLPLTSDFTSQTDIISGHLIVKFVVQLFDDQ